MLSIPTKEMLESDDNEGLYLWRFMIAYEYQNKHYGSQVLDYIVELGKDLGYKKIMTSCQMGDVSPYDFYIKYGFVDTKEVEHGEQILELTF